MCLNSSTHKGGGGGGGEGTGVEEERLRGGVGEEGGKDMTQREERHRHRQTEWRVEKEKNPSFDLCFDFHFCGQCSSVTTSTMEVRFGTEFDIIMERLNL